MQRIVIGLVAGLFLLGACSSGPSKAEQLTKTAKKEDTPADCRKAFTDFDRDYMNALRADDDAAVRSALKTVFTMSVLSCATRELWEQIGEDVDPPLLKMTDAYERKALWRGMCDDFPLPFTAPACTTYRK